MRRSVLNFCLAGGFVAVAYAILRARASPAASYEVSIYTATPDTVWLALALALGIALCISLGSRGPQQAGAIGLGAISVTTIVSLPVIRQYRYAGMGDALSHLGWIRDVTAGEMVAQNLFYPSVHSIASVLYFLTGIPLERATLLTVVVLFVPFVLFVPLVVREMSESALAVGIAAVASWMVLPVNNVATFVGVHTNSNALFFVPVVFFAIVAFLGRDAIADQFPLGISPYSLLVYITGIGLLLIHPQQMINIVLIVGTIAVVQYLARWKFEDHPIVRQPVMYSHAIVLGAIVAFWSFSNERFRSAISGLVYGILAQDIGAGAEVGQRGESLTELGGSLGELFVLMFLEAALIGLLVGFFVLLLWTGIGRVNRSTAAVSNYFALSLFPLGGLFLVYFIGTPTMAFRQVGFIYVVLTILAGVALAYWFTGLGRFVTMPGSTALAAVLLAGCLVLALLTVFGSPIIYNPGQHVTDEQMNGYETALGQDTDLPLVGVGYDPYRFDHGINGIEGEESLSGGTVQSGEVDGDAFEAGNYSGAYGGLDYTLVITEYDENREVVVYQELRHSERAIEALEHDEHVNRVISNDEFRMYVVTAEE